MIIIVCTVVPLYRILPEHWPVLGAVTQDEHAHFEDNFSTELAKCDLYFVSTLNR